MKQMQYKDQRDFEILAQGVYKDIPYYVISRGTHPCAYVDVTNFRKRGSFDHDVDVHGGITYDEDRLEDVWDEADAKFEPDTKRFIGWDYAHSCDFLGGPLPICGTRKYTTEEMVQDAQHAIDMLCDDEVKSVDKDCEISDEDKNELVGEYFTQILRESDDLTGDEIFEDIDGDILGKYDIKKVRELLNFDAFVDVVKRGVRDKYGIELHME